MYVVEIYVHGLLGWFPPETTITSLFFHVAYACCAFFHHMNYFLECSNCHSGLFRVRYRGHSQEHVYGVSVALVEKNHPRP